MRGVEGVVVLEVGGDGVGGGVDEVRVEGGGVLVEIEGEDVEVVGGDVVVVE